MKPFQVLALVLFSAMLLNAAPVSPDKGDLQALQGKWSVTKMIKRGELLAAEEVAAMTFTFSKDSAQLSDRREFRKRSFTFKIDPSKNPKQIDLTLTEGPAKGEPIPGIYKLDEDSLVLCLVHDKNKDRPDAFESLGGVAPSRLLFYLKRVKE